MFNINKSKEHKLPTTHLFWEYKFQKFQKQHHRDGWMTEIFTNVYWVYDITQFTILYCKRLKVLLKLKYKCFGK